MEELSLKDKLTNDYSFKNAANEFTVLYSKDAGKGLKMNDDFTMAVANGEAFGSKDAVIDTDKNGDGRLTYPEAFGIDTCLEYINVSSGVKENIILNKNIGENRFNFIWTSDTLIPILTEDSKSISFVKNNDHQQVDYVVSPLYVYDSYQNTNYENEEKTEDNGNSESVPVSRENTSQSEVVVTTSEITAHTSVTEVSSGYTDSVSEFVDLTTETESAALNTTRVAEKEETTNSNEMQTEEREETTAADPAQTAESEGASVLDSEFTAEDKTTVKHFTEDCHYELTCQTDGVYIITAVISEEFLNDPDTVYPVTIDPSVTSTSTTSNIDDTYVSESYKNTNYGSYTYMCFGYNSGKRFGYVRFNTLPSVPGISQITSANIRLTFRPGQTTSYQGVMYRVAAFNWTETGLTWNNQPYGYDCGAISSHHNCSYYQFEATNLVKGWYKGTYPNYGIDFTYSNETYNDYNSVYSIEGSTASAPKLTIYYNNYVEKTVYIDDDQAIYNSSYRRDLAAQYAYDYGEYPSTSVYDTPGYYSTAYNWGGGAGNDCTNFVSQCLHAGGMIYLGNILTRTENGTWRYDTLLNKYYASYTWGGADNFAWHWGHDPNGVGQQRAYMTVIYPNAQAALDDYDNFVFPNFFDGDVVQTASSTGVSHTMIIHDQFEQTEFYNPDMYLAQHTNNRVEKSLYEMLTIYRNDPNTMFIFHRIK